MSVKLVGKVECSECGRAVISTDYEIHIANKCSLSRKHVRAHLKSFSPTELVARAAAVKAAGKERFKQRKHAAYYARKLQTPSKNLAKQQELQQRLACSDKHPELKRNVEWRQHAGLASVAAGDVVTASAHTITAPTTPLARFPIAIAECATAAAAAPVTSDPDPDSSAGKASP